ncbi:M17 family metallopeptidase [Oceanobacillus jeddahense]|uniref:M17 family metallopeptidase n=1 Tax=Oceanobacillus jeddahense TaxID=1462527 RepID=UPI000694C405|nr:leucyl aminopeptidase family protein [Oceanobacillus jeddahense]
MKAKLIFYKHQKELPIQLQNRSICKFGEIFQDYAEHIDSIYVCYAQPDELQDEREWEKLGSMCYTFVEKNHIAHVEIDGNNCEKINMPAFLEGFYKAGYHFDRYLSSKDRKEVSLKLPKPFENISINAQKAAAAVHVARDICNEPANKLYPTRFADYLTQLFDPTDVEVEIIQSKDLKEKEFYAIETVGKGSEYAPCVAILTLKNSGEDPVALIGKGITFDSGGVNVKTGSVIAEMKMDLGGAAAVIGAMKLLADRNTACHVKAILPMAVNVSGANAYLPSDVIQYRDGTTVEVGNTDAEGRLVIADAILYAQQLGIDRMIDIATLTGNVGQALGLKTAAIYSNDIKLSTKLYKYGQKSGDSVWPMPLEKDYKRYLNSEVADISNMSNHPFAGSITAALFIEHFVKEGTKWIHIDMANTSKIFPSTKLEASGFGTKLLYELIVQREELWDD